MCALINPASIALQVVREVSIHLATLRGRLFSALINVLDTTGGEPTGLLEVSMGMGISPSITGVHALQV